MRPLNQTIPYPLAPPLSNSLKRRTTPRPLGKH